MMHYMDEYRKWYCGSCVNTFSRKDLELYGISTEQFEYEGEPSLEEEMARIDELSKQVSTEEEKIEEPKVQEPKEPVYVEAQKATIVMGETIRPSPKRRFCGGCGAEVAEGKAFSGGCGKQV
jgi:hypothetical protein